MWTRENCARYDRSKLRDESDLTDAEWDLVAPLIPPAKHGGTKRTVNMREIVNGIMYILSTGCQWRAIPKDLPPRSTLFGYLDRWDWDGTLERIHHALYVQCREQAGREASPTVAILDSQSVKSAEKGGPSIDPPGYDAGKKIKEKKRHLLVDTEGLVLQVIVHAANLQDRDGGKLLLTTLFDQFPFLRKLYADAGYQGPKFQRAMKRVLRRVKLEIVRRSYAAKGFVVLAKRWIVERTIGWLNRCRCFALLFCQRLGEPEPESTGFRSSCLDPPGGAKASQSRINFPGRHSDASVPPQPRSRKAGEQAIDRVLLADEQPHSQPNERPELRSAASLRGETAPHPGFVMASVHSASSRAPSRAVAAAACSRTRTGPSCNPASSCDRNSWFASSNPPISATGTGSGRLERATAARVVATRARTASASRSRAIASPVAAARMTLPAKRAACRAGFASPPIKAGRSAMAPKHATAAARREVGRPRPSSARRTERRPARPSQAPLPSSPSHGPHPSTRVKAPSLPTPIATAPVPTASTTPGRPARAPACAVTASLVTTSCRGGSAISRRPANCCAAAAR